MLMDAIATSRAEYKSRAEGHPLSDKERGWILAGYRRRLSVVGVRSQSKCLLERIGHIGKGASDAADRRQKAMRTEEERDSHTMRLMYAERNSSTGGICASHKK